MLIEGLTKDRNHTARQNSAIGLGGLGIHTFKVIIIGLHDDNFQVRKVVEKTVFDNYRIQDVLNLYYNDRKSLLSLKVSVKDIIEKDLLTSKNSTLFFTSLYTELSKLTEDSNQ